jgi:hypothetical protein
MLQVYVSSVSCFKRKLFGWDRRSHVVCMCRRGVWIPVCAHETEKARVVPACVREMQRTRGVPTYAREMVQARASLRTFGLALLWILEMEYAADLP